MKKLWMMLVAVLVSPPMKMQQPTQPPIPGPVITAFAKKFPTGRWQRWDRRTQGYVATFRQNDKEQRAFFKGDGSWQGTGIPVGRTKDLPSKVRAGWMQSDYADWYVYKITFLETPIANWYVLEVNSGHLPGAKQHGGYKQARVLYFTGSGKLVHPDLRKVGLF